MTRHTNTPSERPPLRCGQRGWLADKMAGQRRRPCGRCSMTAAAAAVAAAMQASAVVQEGFDYPTGALDGAQSGGLGFAVASDWGSSSDHIVAGLRYPGLATSGRGAIKSSGYGANPRATATLYGGSSFYLSMLIHANSIETTRFGFELMDGGGPLFGRVNGGWGMLSGPAGKMGISHADGTYQPWVGVTNAADAATHLIVVKIDYEANAIKLHVDPAVNGSEPAPSAILTSGGKWTVNLTNQLWNSIRLFHENANQTADELRIGTTWASVVPVRVSSGDVNSEYFIAPDGSDANDGTVEAPFATLERARDALNLALQTGDLPADGVTIWLRGGLYARTNTFELTTGDSGTAASPITYRAWPRETARLHGARMLPPEWFTSVTDSSPVWARLDTAARGNVMQVDLAAHGITDYGTLRRRGFGSSATLAAAELVFDGAPQQLARWPDVEETNADATRGWTYTDFPLCDTNFTYRGDRPTRWAQAEELWFHGFWRHHWADTHVKAAAVDTGSRLVTFTNVPAYGITNNMPFYAENLLEEITRPGEWYLNRTAGILYFWPPAAPAGHEIQLSMLEAPLVRLTDVQHVTWQDITFEATRGDLLAITRGSHNRVLHCTLRNAGNYAAKISGTRNGFSGCDIANPGDGGIAMSGGTRATLAGAGNYVRNCTIHGFGRWSWMYTPAVNFSGVGQIVAHNLLHDAPHTAIGFGSSNYQLVELNEVRDVCTWSSDAGAIYTGRDLGAHGTIIRHNFVHDVAGQFGAGYGTQGIYLDDCVAGIEVLGNVLFRVSGMGIQHGGGRDDRMVNNVMVQCGRGLGADARGLTWDMSNTWANLQSLPYRGPIWSRAFPELTSFPADWPTVLSSGWLAPRGTVFSRNLGHSNTTWVSNSGNATSYYAEVANNLPNSDPRFVDEVRLDLTLRPDSPAFTIPGFQPIPFDRIGPEHSTLRQLAVWDFPTATDREGFSPELLVVPSALAVNGLAATAAPGHPTWSIEVPHAGLDGVNEAEAVASGDYFEVTLAPRAGQPFSLTSLSFSHRKSGVGAGATLFLRSSADGYAATLGTVTLSGSNVWNTTTFTLSGFAALQGRTAPVTLRLYGHKPVGDDGTQDLALDNLDLGGVGQTFTAVSVAPAGVSVATHTTRRFTASADDQFGEPMANQPEFDWTVTGGGLIDADGVFTAGGVAGGPHAVTAAGGGGIGMTDVTVVASDVRKMKISFEGYGRGETLTNFPILVRLSTGMTNGFAYGQTASPQGYDLRFKDATEAQELNYEVENWNTNGESCVWVQVPRLTAGGHMWASWGDVTLAAAAPAYTTNGAVWADAFTGVWHLGEANPPLADWSRRSNGGTPVGVGVQNGAAGQIASAVRMSQGGVGIPGGGVRVADSATLDFGANDFTLEMWLRKEVSTVNSYGLFAFNKWHSGGNPGTNEWNLDASATGNDNRPCISVEIGTTTHSASSPTSIGLNSWYHIAGLRRGTTLEIYVNGALKGTATGVSGAVNNVPGRDLHFGYSTLNADRSLRGRVDEARVATGARSANWVWACWMNQASNSVLPAMGRVVEAWELADGGAIHWDAGGGTGNTRVGTPANWQSDTLPPFDGSARVAFGVGGAAATIDAPVGFRGILFNRDADFTLDGEGVLTLGEGGLAATLPSATSRRYALAADVALAAHQHWGVTNNAAGTATLEVSGAITDGAAAYGITLSGGGRLVLSGANDYDGPTAVRGGTLTVAPGSNLGNSRNIVVDGAALVLQSQTAIDDNATLAILNGAKVSVGSGLTESLHRLVLDGVAVSGVWGSSVSGADHVDDARFEGGGRLRVLGPDPSRHALPYRESFEGFATGFLLPGFEGWSAGDNGAGLVAAEGPAPLGVLAYTAAVGYPLRHAAHAKVAVFGRALTNALSAPVDAAVWCDLMAQLVRAGEALSPPSSDLQCAFALDADGRLNVWHRDVEGGTNRWTALAWQTPAMVVWARVALHLDYATFDATHNARYFRIFIDGAAQSHTRAYTANDGGGAPGGTWFAFAAAAPNRINSLFFDGGGALDDVVVDTARPLIGLAPLGTPEWWLADAGLTNQLGLAENELEDADDDGFPNWKEHGAGTDPHDPESLLRVTDLPVLPNGRLAAVVQTVPGRRYALEGSSDLASDVWEPAAFAPTPDGEPAVQTAIAATTTMTLYVETAEAHRFYRVQVVRRE